MSELQTQALRHVATVDPALPVPRVWPTREGAFDVTVAGVEGQGRRHVARLLGYLPGEPLANTPPSPAQAASLGCALAGLSLALKDFSHPADSHHLLWDLRHAPELRPLLAHVADPRHRALATAALDRYEDAIVPRLAAFPTQIVHNDGNPHNILVDPADPTRVTGILDFGDMVRTARINDVAIAASYHVTGQDALERPAALVAAYHAVEPLAEVEAEALFDLVALRLAMSVTIPAWRARLHPGNAAYVLRHQARAAAALASLHDLGREAGTARLRRACGVA